MTRPRRGGREQQRLKHEAEGMLFEQRNVPIPPAVHERELTIHTWRRRSPTGARTVWGVDVRYHGADLFFLTVPDVPTSARFELTRAGPGSVILRVWRYKP